MRALLRGEKPGPVMTPVSVACLKSVRAMLGDEGGVDKVMPAAVVTAVDEAPVPESVKVEAVAVYRDKCRLLEATGMGKQAAHEEAISAVALWAIS